MENVVTVSWQSTEVVIAAYFWRYLISLLSKLKDFLPLQMGISYNKLQLRVTV